MKFGHELHTLEQDEDGVDVIFTNGAKERFSFVIGCDGLHSNTRKVLFGDQPADYTGLAMVSGEECLLSIQLIVLQYVTVGWCFTGSGRASRKAFGETSLWRWC